MIAQIGHEWHFLLPVWMSVGVVYIVPSPTLATTCPKRLTMDRLLPEMVKLYLMPKRARA